MCLLYYYLMVDVIPLCWHITIGWCYCHMEVLNLLLFLFCGRCYNHLGWCYCLLYFFVLADVIADVFVVDLITTYITEADVIACFDVFIIGWCYANVYVEDVMSTYCNMRRYGWCYCQCDCGWCYNHRGWCYCLLCLFILLLADVIANVWQMV